MAFAFLFAGIILAVVGDRLVTKALSAPIGLAVVLRWAALWGALGAAKIPIATSYSLAPFLTTTAVAPPWFAKAAPHLEGDPVLVGCVLLGSCQSNAMVWLAIERMDFQLVGAYAKLPG